MFHNVLMTTLTPLANTNEIDQWQNRPFSTIWPEKIQKASNGDAEINGVVRRKPKRLRTAFTTEQLKVLEKTYTRFRYIDLERRRDLAATLNIGERSIKVWFQNRRMKEKRESSESSDSSSEISHEISPPASVKTEPTSPEDYVKLESSSSDSDSQYQLPIYYAHAFPHQFYHDNRIPAQYPSFIPSYPMPTGAPFAQDHNVYPTHYYPNSTDYSRNHFEGNYENANLMGTEYWSNTFDLNYFHNTY